MGNVESCAIETAFSGLSLNYLEGDSIWSLNFPLLAWGKKNWRL